MIVKTRHQRRNRTKRMLSSVRGDFFYEVEKVIFLQALTKELDVQFEQFRNRPIGEICYLVIEGIAKLALEAKFDDFGAGSVSWSLD